MGEKVTHQGFDVEDVISKLTLEEKVALLSGCDTWHTAPVHRLNVPSMRVSDGPNGVRGIRFFKSTPAACLPCGTALAATWDTELIQKGGNLQGQEAIGKGAAVILGPTTNMQRSPLGGRGFESFSEDPVLAGNIAAATVTGIQSTGVSATIKHFVCNDGEHQRMLVDAIVSERALREIYLMPFQITQRDAKPWAYMTSYNRVNGIHVSESKKLIQDVLRSEWGFDGLVMSDWFGVYSTTDSIKAGLDLEMPGKTYIRGELVDQAIRSGKISIHDIDQRNREVLKLVKKTLPLGIPENAEEGTVDSPETAALLRTISSNSIVLLKNDNNILPFKKDKSLAIIGPNAIIAAYCGGGSAALKPYYAVSPLEGFQNQKKDVQYSLGASAWKKLPLLSRLTKTKDGKPGLDLSIFNEPPTKSDRQPVDYIYCDDSEAFLVDYKCPQIEGNLYWTEFTGTFTPDETADYDFSLSVAGTATLFVDGKLVVDNETKQTPGDSFFGTGTHEEQGTIHLEEGKAYNVLVKFATLPTITFKKAGVTPFGAGGVRIGCNRAINAKDEFESALKLAKSVDQVVICAGLNKEWESEGYDRDHMDLPPGSDELIKAITAVNPNTAVVIQSGTPVTMPWAKEVPAILQAWYGGNETGNSIADIIFGSTNPSGKLPLTFPVRNEDNPAFLNYRSEGNRTLYGEDIYIGYRFYEKTKREVLFPFGHGLSYTTFQTSNLNLTSTSDPSSSSSSNNNGDLDDTLTLTALVQNTGSIPGSHVLQAYITHLAPSINRPVKELKGFTKTHLAPNESQTVEISISKKYACSYWDELRDAWVMEKGSYKVLVGDSSASTPLEVGFEVGETKWWRGL